MSKIDFGENCPLTRHLEKVSISDYGCKGQFAGALLCSFDYPHFARLPDITFISQLMQDIAKTKRTDLLSEATEKCIHCPQSDSCEVGALLKVKVG